MIQNQNMNKLKTITWNKSNLLEMILSCYYFENEN